LETLIGFLLDGKTFGINFGLVWDFLD